MESAGESNKDVYKIVGRSPLFFYTVSYLYGILVGNNISLHIFITLILSFTLLFAAFVLFIKAKKGVNFLLDYTLKLLLIMTFFSAGLYNISGSPFAWKNLKSSLSSSNEIKLSLILKESVKIAKNSSRALCFCTDYNESILVYFPKDISFVEYEPGDTIKSIVKLREFASSNQKQIEYKRYLKTKRIFFYSFLKKGEFEIIKPVNRSLYYRFIIKRNIYINKIREMAEDELWIDLLMAILIGEKRWLDSEIKSAFASSGAMHMMAVSGLHAGFIFIFISFITSILGNRLFFKITRTILTLSLLWGYCAVAGFSHSSVRAVIMISMLLINKIINRPAISLNSLCSSALIITVLSPEALYDTGFQLSYAALLSIIFINPKIESYVKTKNRVLKWFWALIAVSISCQIGTAPISIAKFGIFPIYFLLANVIMLPLTASLIYLASLSLIIHLLGSNSEITIEIMRFISELLIKIAYRIESLPFSTLELTLNPGIKLVIISLIIVTFIDTGISKARKKYIYAALIINLIIMYLQS